jgi:putative lumazine-binding protein
MKRFVAAPLLALALAWPAAGQAQANYSQATGPATPAADAAAEIQDLLQRHARAWYEGNPALMAPTLHPEYRRTTIRHSPTKPDAVDVASGLALLDMTDRGLGRLTNATARKAEVTQLRVEGGKAWAQLALADRVELLQLARWNNQWRVIASLVERNEP